jgi:hypothetical protein
VPPVVDEKESDARRILQRNESNSYTHSDNAKVSL